MLTVEQRHALIVQFEESLTQQQHFTERCTRPGDIEAVLRRLQALETAKRQFYEVVNELTNWGSHPAVREVSN